MLIDRFENIKRLLPADVNLLAVSKGVPASSIRLIANAGQVHFGESRVQEALPKMEQLSDLHLLRWHFIGNLQSNKVRSVVKAFEFIHSVDSLSLAQRISRIAREEQKKPKILLQVKLLPDPTKGGLSKDEILEVWPNLIALNDLQICGLMTMSPMSIAKTSRKLLFKDCKELANQLELKECSMGMSGDWEEALDAGSTWLRLGRILFKPDK